MEARRGGAFTLSGGLACTVLCFVIDMGDGNSGGGAAPARWRAEQGLVAREGAGAEARHDGAGAARARHVVVRAEQGWRRVMGGAKA